MDINVYNAQIQKIYDAFWGVKSYYGNGTRMKALCAALTDGLGTLKGDVSGIKDPVPADGDDKPPKVT